MQTEYSDITIIYLTETGKNKETSNCSLGCKVQMLSSSLSQEEYVGFLEGMETEKLILVDGKQVGMEMLTAFIRQKKQQFDWEQVGYMAISLPKCRLKNIRNLWYADPQILTSPVLVGSKSTFLKAYAGSDLGSSTLTSIGYSLQKIGGLKFAPLLYQGGKQKTDQESPWKLWYGYTIRLPFNYLISGQFFAQLFCRRGKVKREMCFRFFFFLLVCFSFLFLPYISKDFGVTGDEFVDHRHAGYVLDYFARGDKAALHQPQTALHLYGNAVQVITAVLCRWFQVDHYYELRHVVGGLVGALGILAAGWMGLRWGGGLTGLLCMLLMLFTPRFLGHSMNNLKDVPFAVGYMLALFYTVRLFDYYPYFRLRHLLGLILGIALALGTRSGGLILYPMLLMYAGLFYISNTGIRNFYKFKQHGQIIGEILSVILLAVAASYILSILLWPFALERPLRGVIYSLTQFTNYGIGLRTIFDGEQMMSNMLPWRYAPQYLCIGMPIVVLVGFFLYWIYMFVRKREFSLISFFLLFATIFPVYWVIHCQSNLYGGIRHLLFVMPPMVVLAGRFWGEMIHWGRRYLKLLLVLIFVGLLYLPISHTLRNHPNEYVYFNELVGGLKNVYGDYETDYYFNSLKDASDWFRSQVLPTLPTDKKTVVATQAAEIMKYYFRHDTNIKITYSRYYEKYGRDWDYAIFGNVYISPYQLKNQLFPPQGTLYSPTVDGFPMSIVMKRETKAELQGFQLEKEKKYEEAIQVFEKYVKEYPDNEEVYSKLGKLYYMTENYAKAKEAFEQALRIQPAMNEALYISAMTYLELKEYSKALQNAERMLADNKFSAEAEYLRALAYYHMREYNKAISALNDLFQLTSKHEQGLMLAGNIFRDNGDFKQAAKMYEQALRLSANAEVAVRLAEMWVRLGWYAQADQLLNQMKALQDAYYPIHKVRCRMWLQQKKLKEAKESLKKMEQIQDDAEVFVLNAWYEKLNQRTDQASQWLDKALKLEPAHKEALLLMKEMN